MEEDIIKEFLEEKNAKKVDLISLLRTFKKEGLENFIVIRTEKLENLLKAYKEGEAVIEEMAKNISETIINCCPYEDYGVDLDCENRCSCDDDIYAECWKMYFRTKVKGEKE